MDEGGIEKALGDHIAKALIEAGIGVTDKIIQYLAQRAAYEYIEDNRIPDNATVRVISPPKPLSINDPEPSVYYQPSMPHITESGVKLPSPGTRLKIEFDRYFIEVGGTTAIALIIYSKKHNTLFLRG